jgi:Recombinase
MRTTRIRDQVSAIPGTDYFKKRLDEGWRPVAVEWERTSDNGEETWLEDVPYGFRIADDGQHLSADPHEQRVLRSILASLIEEKSFTEIARELNDQGHLTRAGALWTETTVHELLPRVVESAPRIYETAQWRSRTFFPPTAPARRR